MQKLHHFKSGNQKLLFFSDPHLGHVPKSWTPLYVTRGFNSITEHDDWFFSQWEKHVDKETIVFCLGDVAFNDADSKRFNRFASLPAKKHFVMNGNHLSGMKQAYASALHAASIPINGEFYPLDYQNITFTGYYLHAFIDGVSVYMQHYPQYVWPEQGDGGFCLCGHCHGNAHELNPTGVTTGKILDIGFDNAIAYNQSPFFSWEDIKIIMDKKPIVTRDHH